MGSSHALTTCTDLYFRPKLVIISNFIVVIIPMLCEQLPASYGLRSGSFSLTTRSAAEPLGLARLPMCTSTTQADLSPIYLSQWLGQDTPAASRVNLFTWNSSYQVRCAELTDALPHRWTRHHAPWCLDAFPITLSRRPPIPAVAPPQCQHQ